MQIENIPLDPLAGPDGSEKGRKLATFWKDQINTIRDSAIHKRWVKRGETIEKRYRDERNRVDEEGQRRYNSLWANVEILKPAIYGKMPLPVAERRFKDRDPVGRNAAQMLERGLRNEVEISGFDESMQQAVTDYLLPGRGIVWVRYEPEMGIGPSIPLVTETDQSEFGDENEESDESPEAHKLSETSDRIIRESTPVDFIPWEDFFTFPVRARSWKEVTAIGKRIYLSRDQMIGRFGKEIGKAIPLEKDDRGLKGKSETSQADVDGEKGVVFEIWDRDEEEVIWVAMGYEWLCDRKDDFLKLENFYPVPRPLYANATNNTLVPVPDYIQYQDQAIQIDELTQRIAMLTKACKVAGVYNAAAKDIQRLFDESVENELIPVDDWAAFGDTGGVEGNISLLPLQVIKDCVNELMMAKDKQVLEMDRLTGITDIMRGTTDARETLGGQRLKTNSAGTRLQKRQNEVARFARDTVRIMADIMCRHFSPQSLVEVSGALFEEGLGPSDMPDLTALMPPQAQQSQTPGQGGAPPPTPGQPSGAGAVPQLPAGPAPSSPPGATPGIAPPGGTSPPTPGGVSPLPGAPPGQNVVPFRPQGGAPLQGQVLPPLPQQFQPPPPQIPPEILEKLKAFQRIGKAIELLRNERLRGFRVDIEVDSTIYGDTEQDKADRTQFLQAVTMFLQQSMMMTAQVPQMAPLLGKLLQFGVRGFRVGRDLELAIEEFTDQAPAIAMQHQQAQAGQPNPDLAKAQAEIIKAQTAVQVGSTKAASEMARAQADMEAVKLDASAEQARAQAEIQRQAIENAGELQNAQQDTEQKEIDYKMRMIELQIELERLKAEKIKARAQVQSAKHDAISSKADIEIAKHKVAEAKARPKTTSSK